MLFLDELPEFKRTVLEVLRQPLEDRVITISRAKFSVDYPASFMLIAAMNPCPCGYYNHPHTECMCGPGNVQKYLNKISDPLFDRITNVSRTITDIDKQPEIKAEHMAEAIQYRSLDRESWGK